MRTSEIKEFVISPQMASGAVEIAKESVAIQTGCLKNANEIVGTHAFVADVTRWRWCSL